MKTARVRGIGAYLPERVMENAAFADELGLETSDDWIRERTGIKRRHIAADGETTSDLGYHAGLQALEHAGVAPGDIDLVLVATSTPDLTFPSTATMIQHRLGTSGAAFDLQAVCSGFIYGMHTANALIRAGAHKRILLIGAETFSRILDWEDRTTCVLFGDGAGAVVLEAADDDSQGGVIHSVIHSDGAQRDLLYVDGGPSATQTVGKLRMAGRAVFKHAVTDIAKVIEECADAAGVDDVSSIDWFVPHQANQRILTAVAKRLKLRPEQVVSTVAEHANTSAASVPLAWNAAVRDGRVKRGDTVMLEAFGGGFTWGACLLRY